MLGDPWTVDGGRVPCFRRVWAAPDGQRGMLWRLGAEREGPLGRGQ